MSGNILFGEKYSAAISGETQMKLTFAMLCGDLAIDFCL